MSTIVLQASGRSVEVPGETLAEAAYRALEELIVTRRLRPGSMISENQLSEQLGCGRTPIREALQRLKFEGFVEIHPRRGVLVAPIDVVKQLELLEVRRPLESTVVRLAAKRALDRERAEMARLAVEIRAAAKAADPVRYVHATRSIHEVEAQAAHNSILAGSIGVIHSLSRRFWYAFIEETGGFPENSETHAVILQAIVAGDAEDAAAGANLLMDHLEQLTRSALDRRTMR